MTIEQAIKEFRTPTVITPSGTQFDKDCLQVADWLEDYQKCKADLEIYKKALKMACKTLSWEGTDEVVNKYIDYHLTKARE